MFKASIDNVLGLMVPSVAHVDYLINLGLLAIHISDLRRRADSAFSTLPRATVQYFPSLISRTPSIDSNDAHSHDPSQVGKVDSQHVLMSVQGWSHLLRAYDAETGISLDVSMSNQASLSEVLLHVTASSPSFDGSQLCCPSESQST